MQSNLSIMSVPPFPNTEFKYTEPFNKSWTIGQGVDATPEGKQWVDGEKQGWKVVDTATEDSTSVFLLIQRFSSHTFVGRKLYQLMISGIVPRPIAYVSSVSESGVENLAPFRYAYQVLPVVRF